MKNNRCVIQPFMLKKVLHDAKKEKKTVERGKKQEREKPTLFSPRSTLKGPPVSESS